MKTSKKFTETLLEAKKLFKLKTGYDYDTEKHSASTINIYKLKTMKTKTRKYFIGSHIEWLNL